MTPSPVVAAVKSGAMIIEVRSYADGRFGFDFPIEGERTKIRLKTLAAAQARAKALIATGQAGKLNLLAIDPKDFAEFLQWRAARRKTKHTAEIIEDFVNGKKALAAAGEITPQHAEDMGRILEAFGEDFDAPLDAISRADFQKWLDDQGDGAKRWNSKRAAVVAVVRYARTERLIGPEITPIEQVQKRSAKTVIETFAPAELVKILRVVEKEWIASVALGAFAGVRPEEICPALDNPKPALEWRHVIWAKAKLDIPKEISKTGRRRFVPLCDAAMAFIADFRNESGPMVPRKALGNAIRRWTAKSGVLWKNDGLRHSFASYRLALTQDIQALSLEMGNSPKIIHDHYLELKHEDEAAEWFAIRPETLELDGTLKGKKGRGA